MDLTGVVAAATGSYTITKNNYEINLVNDFSMRKCMTHTAKGLSIFGSPKGFSSNLSIFQIIISLNGTVNVGIQTIVYGLRIIFKWFSAGKI